MVIWDQLVWSDPLLDLAQGFWGPALLAWKVRDCWCLGIVLERGMLHEWESGRPQELWIHPQPERSGSGSPAIWDC